MGIRLNRRATDFLYFTGCDLIHVIRAGLDGCLKIVVSDAQCADQAGVLAARAPGVFQGGVDESAIVPADELGPRKGLVEEFLRPFDALLHGVGDGAEGIRHLLGLTDHGER